MGLQEICQQAVKDLSELDFISGISANPKHNRTTLTLETKNARNFRKFKNHLEQKPSYEYEMQIEQIHFANPEQPEIWQIHIKPQITAKTRKEQINSIETGLQYLVDETSNYRMQNKRPHSQKS